MILEKKLIWRLKQINMELETILSRNTAYMLACESLQLCLFGCLKTAETPRPIVSTEINSVLWDDSVF